MGFKVDSSFLKFLTIGAAGTQKVMQIMREAGLQPIELERYSATNKIWSTKVKRLRLPDLLCVRTGLRVEVRAKSLLALKMSDAPENLARRWFAGLRREDMVAFIQCGTVDSRPEPAETAELFWVGDLLDVRESVTRLGPPKSASEGSERDREWPTIVPTQSGTVLDVTVEHLRSVLDGGRAQTWRLNGKVPYLRPGERFVGYKQFIAGAPARKAFLHEVQGRQWQPSGLATSGDAVDRYVCAKALGVVGTQIDIEVLRELTRDADPRIALEAAGSLAKLGHEEGLTRVAGDIWQPSVDYLRMEALFILSELANSPLHRAAADLLDSVAQSSRFSGTEAPQAAIWGLGYRGLREYLRLIPYLSAESADERIHALVALGPNLPIPACNELVAILLYSNSTPVARAAACYAIGQLRDVGYVAGLLQQKVRENTGELQAWAIAALGALDGSLASAFITDDEVSTLVRPTQLSTSRENWTRSPLIQEQLAFVSQQVV